ncbi:ATP-grasp domain-containing protein [Corynebacterium occultum]|uniref:ATP-grasp domain-containing protein n=1 Tax=Corynebacterium occultum TaxID=2675219 RepID=UPI0022B1E65E|nr:ATP-grasp domain-containing protein [Corynebacterium occultum]
MYKHPPATEQICRRKHLTKRMLDLANLSTPAGGDFAPSEPEVAAAFFEKMPKPVVVKATDSGGSKGVTVGVRNREQFELAWSHALADGRKSSNVLIEKYVDGVELRAFVIGDEVVSVVARIQPFVEGDGIRNLTTLIEEIHKSREVHYRAKKMPVVIKWEFIAGQGYQEDSVPAAGEIVFLNPFNTPTNGGFILDVTSAVCDEIKELSIRSMQAIPHLEVAGIDLMVSDLGDADTAYVIEVNTAASLELHRYPTHGEPRAVDLDIVEYFNSKYGEK